MTTADPAPREFGGPLGNLGMIIGLPIFVYYLFFAVRFNGGALLPSAGADLDGFFAAIAPTWVALGAYLGWVLLQVLLQVIAPGPVVEGTLLEDGTRLRYRVNGRASVLATALVIGALVATGWLDPAFAYDHFGALLTVMIGAASAFSMFLYVYGPAFGQRATHSGSLIHDLWMGRGHDPRVPPGGLFDLKFFCEGRPGLILWVLIDLSFACAQHRAHGVVTTPMILVCAFQAIYVLDYFWNERAILTTMDIKHERFGTMLAFGDLVWVPMTYSLQAFYLVEHAHELHPAATAAIVATHLAGLAIFRAVNNQKNRFRSDPDGARIWGRTPEFIQTARGTRLLVSGFWGWSRHFNYVGDLLMATSWSLPCLFDSLLPWFYPVYFAILLAHRERRDHHFCSMKYGPDWDRYCERVPWRIIPGIY